MNVPSDVLQAKDQKQKRARSRPKCLFTPAQKDKTVAAFH